MLLWVSTCVLVWFTVNEIRNAPSASVLKIGDDFQSDIDSARKLATWRTGSDVQGALAAAQDYDQLPIPIPVPTLDVRETARIGDAASTISCTPNEFSLTVLREEFRRCRDLGFYINARNEAGRERAALVVEHRARVDRIALSFPAIKNSMDGFVAEFQRAFTTVREELSDITITTTRGGRSVGSGISGLSHWSTEVRSVQTSLDELRATAKPYERALAAERGCSALAKLKSAIASIPTDGGFFPGSAR